MSKRAEAVRSPKAGERLVVLSAPALVLVAYLRTLYPGIVGNRDTAKFQFVGHVLGTPHNPGYPLYVLLTYAFGHLPIGTLAYRINLFSALLGAVAVALMARAFRRLGLGVVAAAALGVAVGLGQTFWSQAILAEVYMLAACFLAGAIVCLLEWRRAYEDRWLIGAIACAAIGLGNHLTIAMVAPAFVAFVVVERPREILRPRIVGATIALTIAGLLPYLFILLRTHQRAAYLESSATSLPELWKVMRAQQFQSWLWAYTPSQILHDRLPLLVGLIRDEYSIAGIVFLVLGLGWAFGRDRALAALVVVGSGAILFFAANYRAPDIEVFLIPAFQLGWLAVAAAGAWLSTRNLGLRRATSVAAIVLAIAFAKGNWKMNDHSRRVWEGQLLGGLSDVLPHHSVILAEGGGSLDWVMDYALYGEEWGRERDMQEVVPDPAVVTTLFRDGWNIFTFATTRHVLESAAMTLESVRVPGPNVFDHLCDEPVGTTVLVAGFPGSWLGPEGHVLRCLGLPPSGVAENDALVAVAGTVRGASMDVTGHGSVGRGLLPRGRIAASVDGPHVALDLAAAHPACDGCLLYAAVAPDGRVLETDRLEPADRLRVPLPYVALSRLVSVSPCQPIGNQGWTTVTSAASMRLRLRIDNYRPFASSVDVAVAGIGSGFGRTLRVDGPAEATYAVSDPDTFPTDLPTDLAGRLRAAGATKWRHLDVTDQGQFLVVDLEIVGRPDIVAVRATVDLPNPRRAVACEIAGDPAPAVQ